MPRPGLNCRLADGTVTIYCHGQPGGVGELALFGPERAAKTNHWHVLDRSDGDLTGRAMALAGGHHVHLIGFSLGGPVAVALASQLGEQICRVDLIATAAGSPDRQWPGDMAGKPIFDLARDHPSIFALLALAQRAMAAIAPAALMRRLFVDARGEDAGLIADSCFRDHMRALLQEALTANWRSYRREVADFAARPLQSADAVSASVHFWHGDKDNWAPIALAKALSFTVPSLAAFHILPDKSHYSTLRAFLDQYPARDR